MREDTIHAWETDGKRYRAVYDYDFDAGGLFACGECDGCSKADSKFKHLWERRKIEESCDMAIECNRDLESGKYIAIGIIVSELAAPNHCASCTCGEMVWKDTDSLWGIVIEPGEKKIEEFAREEM